MKKDLITKTSKFLSFVLRHNPGAIDLKLDENGWASVDELLSKARKSGRKISPELLQEVVATNNKKRFTFDESGERIRANQGHSIKIDLDLSPVEPPEFLWHGTATRNLDSIFDKGLVKGSRHHVHLSEDTGTALNVGGRYGKPVLLRVFARKMHAEGIQFFKSKNGVWLTDYIAPEYFELKD